MTAAWWQVLGGVLDQPRSIADIGRRMGVTPQGVRRVANILVERGLAEYVATPVDTRTRLLACTEAGYWAVRRIAVVTHPWADAVAGEVGRERLEAALEVMRELVDLIEGDEHRPPGPPR
jgi:DNA-binding MarR family transcriptional regulator